MGFNILKAVGGVVKNVVPGAGAASAGLSALSKAITKKGGSASLGSSYQQPDSIKTQSTVGPGGIISSQSSTTYFTPGAGQGTAVAPAAGCALVWDGRRFRTTHPNKAAYVTRGGGTSRWPRQLQLHPKGSVCVTHRKMNPGNGKAVVHAVRRVTAFHHLAKRVERVLQRVAKKTVHRGKKSCGCK